jgi:uncharacterized HAD superfamily protein/adenine/guanine phosphoribosyltransferase-like PRPP-binding protein
MRYRSLSDLSDLITSQLHRVPADIDLVVGIPRSGILPAITIALLLNLRYADLDSYLAGRLAGAGSTKRHGGLIEDFGKARHVLVIDDSLNRGCAMREARERLAHLASDVRFTFAAAYVVPDGANEVDLAFAILPLPRMFEWNFIHHPYLAHACVDIDGVLCLDPCANENDDGPGYLGFLAGALPLYRPTRRIACLVTSRLEKYRPQTEDWLARHGVEYDRLVMLDLPTAAERRRRGVHGSYKGEVYRDSKAIIFIESEYRQAVEIARISGKAVLSIEGQRIVTPDGLSVIAPIQKLRNFGVNAQVSDSPLTSREALKRRMRRVLPRTLYEATRDIYIRVRKEGAATSAPVAVPLDAPIIAPPCLAKVPDIVPGGTEALDMADRVLPLPSLEATGD